MSIAKDAIKASVNGILAPFDMEIRKKLHIYHCSYRWSADAKKAGMDVNDFIEKDHNKPALAELQALAFPHISSSSVVCELGPGTGCYTRRLLEKVTDGTVHIVDFDEYTIEFLKQYFKGNPRALYHLNSGYTLPAELSDSVDLVFASSVFTGTTLTYTCAYIDEFARVLKPGGFAVFDYFDVAADEGWNNLMENMAKRRPIFNYNYHATSTIDKLLTRAGLTIVERRPSVRGSTYVTARKPAP
jgi:ubiquinone/menaquinone biosynthesis C-methylase UbiE